MESLNLDEKLAEQQLLHDRLVAKYRDVDRILIAVGFPRGLASLKEIANEVLQQDIEAV